MEAPSVGDLDTLKYSELRKLAKAAGLKANQKADRLLRTLKKHFHPAVITEGGSSDSDGNSTLTDDSQVRPDEEEQISLCHVTHRRGRGKKAIQVRLISPEKEVVIKSIQGDATEDAAEEASVPVSTRSVLQSQPITDDETPEDKVDAVEKTTRRRSKNRRSSGKKPGRKIPRNSIPKAESKPSTPNFKKLHEAYFKKMESIDRYLERKQKRQDAMSSSTQDEKLLRKSSDRLSQKKTPGSSNKKSLQNRFSLLSPAPQTGYLFSAKTPTNRRSAGKRSILVDKSGAKTSTFSSSKMNVRFSGATKDNEHKYSLVKTPARKSSTFMPSISNSAPRKSLPLSSRKSAPSVKETSVPAATTPFKFAAENMATPNTNQKMKFDLKASLARPLGYQPHKGKLKPWGETKENSTAEQNKSYMLKNTYKQPPLSTSRVQRRRQQAEDRKNKRDQIYESRRRTALS